MRLDYIIKIINKLVNNNSSWGLGYSKLEFYLDSAVDYINNYLGTSFKTIQESYSTTIDSTTDLSTVEYTEIPNKYIRQILIYYASALFLEEEDETEQQYQIYKQHALEALEEWRSSEYTCFDITDNDYDYSIMQPLKYNIANIKHLREDVYKVTDSYKEYLAELKLIQNPDKSTLNLIDQLEYMLLQFEGVNNV